MNHETTIERSEAALQQRSRSIIALTALTAISAAITIAAGYLGSRTTVYIFKPATMIFIIIIGVIALMTGPGANVGYRNLIIAGLCCSLVGDGLLMLPSDQFVPGLISFLIAHLLYIAAFRSRPSGLMSAWYGAACVVYGSLMFWILSPGLGAMKLPVVVYLIVILTMAWQALNRWGATRQAGAALAAIGAMLFVVSDSAIAINRFRVGFRLADLLILATYFAAQWLIAMSIASGADSSLRLVTPLRGQSPDTDKVCATRNLAVRPTTAKATATNPSISRRRQQ
ncbi:MAG: lysoplasmalogenase [Acidobacteriota bacterium]